MDYLKEKAYLENQMYIRTVNMDIDYQVFIFHCFVYNLKQTNIVDEVYKKGWANEVETLNNTCMQNNFHSELVNIQVGECHSIVVDSKQNMYTWGLNDYT